MRAGQRHLDVAHGEYRDRGSEGHADAHDGERAAGERGRDELRRDDHTTARLDDQRRADRPVPELARDGEEACERGEEHTDGHAAAEQVALRVLRRERVEIARERLDRDAEQAHRPSGEQQQRQRPRGAQLEQLGAQLMAHVLGSAVSSRNTSSSEAARVDELAQRRLDDQPATVDDHEPIDGLGDLRQVVAGDEHRPPLVRECA